MQQTPRGQPKYPLLQKRIFQEDLIKVHQYLDKSSKVPDTVQDCRHHTQPGATVNTKHAMDAAVRKLPPGATLNDLIQAISPWTTDGGKPLMQVMDDVLWLFHESMERYIDKYIEQRYELLFEKSNELKAHYKKLQEAVITKHKELKAAVPKDFNWDLYYKDANYLQNVLQYQEQPQPNINHTPEEVLKQFESNKEWYESDLKSLQMRKKELTERVDYLQKEILERKYAVKAAQIDHINLQGHFRSLQNQLNLSSPH